MLGGLNPRSMQKAMRKMGVSQEDVPAKEVIIRLQDKDLVFSNPSVARVKMMGQESYQISGEVHERMNDAAPDISAEDVKAVMDQANVDEETARKAIQQSEGDLAAAILALASDP